MTLISTSAALSVKQNSWVCAWSHTIVTFTMVSISMRWTRVISAGNPVHVQHNLVTMQSHSRLSVPQWQLLKHSYRLVLGDPCHPCANVVHQCMPSSFLTILLLSSNINMEGVAALKCPKGGASCCYSNTGSTRSRADLHCCPGKAVLNSKHPVHTTTQMACDSHKQRHSPGAPLGCVQLVAPCTTTWHLMFLCTATPHTSSIQLCSTAEWLLYSYAVRLQYNCTANLASTRLRKILLSL